MIKFLVKGRVLLATKDFIFIFASLVMLLFILDAFADQPRIGTYFLYVLVIFDFIYALKVVDNYNLQKTKEAEKEIIPESEEKTRKVIKIRSRYFEA